MGTAKIIISPSILACNLLTLESEIKDIEAAGADWHHIDVMDGHFVPNLTFGPPLIREIKKITKLPLDVHIMVSNPDVVADDYIKAGADILVFHLEASAQSKGLIEHIKKYNIMAGIAINPETPISRLGGLLDIVDMITIMSVNPGFHGQKYIPQTAEKISLLSSLINEKKSKNSPLIQADGGIEENTAKTAIKAGAQVLVSGSYVYQSKNRKEAIKKLRNS